MTATTTVLEAAKTLVPPVDQDAINSIVNPRLERAEYAVRGAITDRAAEIEKQLASGVHSFPFDKILYCNIGNPQALGQKPVSYARRLLACCECPELAESDAGSTLFPADVVEMSRHILKQMPVGAYTTSFGAPVLRQMVADGISKRDGHEAAADSVFLSNGASSSVHTLLAAMITDSKDAFLVPVPQYPLYSSALTLYGGTLLPYYLDENSNWGVDVTEMERIIEGGQRQGLRIRGLVVINPGNPTGQVLSCDNQKKLMQLCAGKRIPVIADEVYQENVWDESKTFTSFRKVALDHFKQLQPVVFSLHSTSKGYFGECGHRGGYMDVLNCPARLLAQIEKLKSISLCSNTAGQVLVAAMMCPPQPGSPSYEEYNSERSTVLASLARRAKKMAAGLRKLEGVTCCDSEGALYVFPRIRIPEAAQREARQAGQQPDFLYCLQLLNATGIVAVPGSGFEQAPGTFHMRLTILPPEEDIDSVMQRLSRFHEAFMLQYRA